MGDFVVRRADGSAAFFFSNAVDDACMGVTLALRGEDHLTNTPRQLLILGAVGLKAPAYGHVALLVGAEPNFKWELVDAKTVKLTLNDPTQKFWFGSNSGVFTFVVAGDEMTLTNTADQQVTKVRRMK